MKNSFFYSFFVDSFVAELQQKLWKTNLKFEDFVHWNFISWPGEFYYFYWHELWIVPGCPHMWWWIEPPGNILHPIQFSVQSVQVNLSDWYFKFIRKIFPWTYSWNVFNYSSESTHPGCHNAQVSVLKLLLKWVAWQFFLFAARPSATKCVWPNTGRKKQKNCTKISFCKKEIVIQKNY